MAPLLGELRQPIVLGDAAAIDKLVLGTPDAMPAGTFRILGRAVAQSHQVPATREALLALMDAWVARSRGCHVVAAGR